MKTGLSKKQKTTNVYFNEADSMIEVCTYNTSLKNRLSIGRFGFKLTAPYDENRRKAASELAKKNTEKLRRQEQ